MLKKYSFYVKIRGEYFGLFVLCFLQILFFLSVLMLKIDLFQDEYFTLNISNSRFCYFTDNIEALLKPNTWLTKDLLMQLIVNNVGIDYNMVYNNTAADVHPPLYYYIIHSIYAFFPGSCNLWLGIFPNFIFFLVTQIFIFKVNKMLLKDSYIFEDSIFSKFVLFMPCIIYGFSIGCASMVLFLRMYALLAMFCMALFYWLVCYFDSTDISRKRLFIITVNCFLGFLTHYYYLLFSGILGIFYVIVILKNRQYMKGICLLLSGLAGIFLAVLYYPACINHILGIGPSGYRGAEIINGLGNLDYFQNFITYVNGLFVIEQVPFIIALACVASWIVLSSKSGFVLVDLCNINSYIGFVSCMLVIITLVFISSLVEIRYLWMIIPVFVVCTNSLAFYTLKKNHKFDKRKKLLIIISILVGLLYQMSFYNFTLYGGIPSLNEIKHYCSEKGKINQVLFIPKLYDDGTVNYGCINGSFGIIKCFDKTLIVKSNEKNILTGYDLDNNVLLVYCDGNFGEFYYFVNKKLGYVIDKEFNSGYNSLVVCTLKR